MSGCVGVGVWVLCVHAFIGIAAARVYLQSFRRADVAYWQLHAPAFAAQALPILTPVASDRIHY